MTSLETRWGRRRTVQLRASSEMSKEKGVTVNSSIKASATRGPPSRLPFAR